MVRISMDKAEYFGDDRDEDLLGALAKITYHVRREKQEAHRQFFNRWQTAMRKVAEHKVFLPDKYIGFLLVNALNLTEPEIKSLLNYTRGSIMPPDIKDWVRKHETKLQVAQVGLDPKKNQASSTKASGNFFVRMRARMTRRRFMPSRRRLWNYKVENNLVINLVALRTRRRRPWTSTRQQRSSTRS
jgi:hypothetical protein